MTAAAERLGRGLEKKLYPVAGKPGQAVFDRLAACINIDAFGNQNGPVGRLAKKLGFVRIGHAC